MSGLFLHFLTNSALGAIINKIARDFDRERNAKYFFVSHNDTFVLIGTRAPETGVEAF